MALLLIILIPLAALVIYAVVFDLRRRGAAAPSGVTTSARRRAWLVRTRTPVAPAASHSRDPGRGSGSRPLTILMFHGQGRGWRLARSGESCHRLPL